MGLLSSSLAPSGLVTTAQLQAKLDVLDAPSAKTLSTNRTNWVNNGAISAVVGQLAWKNYNNNHTIFDASAGTSPTGTAVNATNTAMPWVATHPTLMGWNGENTYGVRVDSARRADSAATADSSNAASSTWFSASIAGSTVQGNATASVEVRNNGDTTDAAVAAIAFHCLGTYVKKLHLRHDGYFGAGGGSGVAWGWYLDPNHNMVAAGNVSAYSDPRLKENFERITNPMGILDALDGGTFNWKHGIPHIAGKAGKRDYGILADQVEAVMPEIVSESVDIEGESYRTVAYEKLVPVLIEAVKALDARVKELEAR